jgi:hypothetical protein
MGWTSYRKVPRRRGISKWGKIWVEKPCVNLTKNGLSFNPEAVIAGLCYGTPVEILLEDRVPGLIAFRILDADEAAGVYSDRAWIVQRNGSGKKDYGTRISNRGLSVTIGSEFFGQCSTLEKNGNLLIAQFQATKSASCDTTTEVKSDTGRESQTGICDVVDLALVRGNYPDDMIVSGRKQASAALGLRDVDFSSATPLEILKSGSVTIHRYRVGDLRRWHAKKRFSKWAALYGSES